MLAVVEQDQDQGTTILGMLAKKFPNYHPVIAIAEIAHDKDASLDLQFNCHKTIAKYVLPELKSVEVRVNDKKRRMVTVSLFDNEVQEGQIVEDTPMELGMTMVGEVIEADRDGF